MTRTTLRARTARPAGPTTRTVRAVAIGAAVLALAAGCSGADQGEDGGAPAEDPAPASDGGGSEEDGAAGDDAAASDGGASDGGGADPAASDGGGADAGQEGSAGAALPEDADLATEQLPITAERAVEIATETVGGGDLVQIEIDHDDRAWEWELELVEDGTQHELDIDATTGEVTQHDTDEDDDQDPAVDVTAPMAYDEAIGIALGEEPGRVSSWSLDSDDGTVRYQIDIDRTDGGDVEVEVDVETGDVRVDD